MEKARADRQVEREDGRVGQAREGEEGCERGRTREVSRQEGGGDERECNETREMQIEFRKATYESLNRNLLSTFKKWPNFPLS